MSWQTIGNLSIPCRRMELSFAFGFENPITPKRIVYAAVAFSERTAFGVGSRRAATSPEPLFLILLGGSRSPKESQCAGQGGAL
jgi:hypothetical protein